MTSGDRLDHLSQLSLDLLLLGDLGEEASRNARAHIEGCPSCREKYDSMRRSYQHFERHVHPNTVARVTATALSKEPGATRSRVPPWGAPLAVLVTLAAGLFLWVRPQARAPSSSASASIDDRVIAAKGTPIFTVYARHAGRVSALDSGAALEPGDALRFTADPGGYGFLLIASIDAAGHASIYWPYLGRESAPIAPDRHFADEFSIVLDGTRGPERIFALFSNRALTAAIVQSSLAAVGRHGPEAIRSTVRIDVPADFQASLLIEK